MKTNDQRVGAPRIVHTHGSWSRKSPHVDPTAELRTRDGGAAATRDDTSGGTPSLIPSKPPIRLEEGLVEVGWDGDLEAELTESDESSTDRENSASVESPFDEQLVDDRYAAMQAWTEWSRNRERPSLPEERPDTPEPSPVAPESPVVPIREDRPVDSDSALPANIRAGGPHDFAPYSQLFTRLRQSKQG